MSVFAMIEFIIKRIAQTGALSGPYIDTRGGKNNTRKDARAIGFWNFALQNKAWIHLDGAARYTRRSSSVKVSEWKQRKESRDRP